jgi:methylated-DNA-[protein]-cysteine S-methyltransferase
METRNKTNLEYAAFKTDLGWAVLLASRMGLMGFVLPQATREKALSLLNIQLDEATESDKQFQDLINRLQDYFRGKKAEFNDKLDLTAATSFQHRVWLAARTIPIGSVHSYGWIAQHIGQPEASRAVGQALGKNPLPVIIPCHRVLSATGNLGGFTGGLEVKIRLLKLEGFELIVS